MVTEVGHSKPTSISSVHSVENVQRTPRTPGGSKTTARFYPVVKDGTSNDPQVTMFLKIIFKVNRWIIEIQGLYCF